MCVSLSLSLSTFVREEDLGAFGTHSVCVCVSVYLCDCMSVSLCVCVSATLRELLPTIVHVPWVGGVKRRKKRKEKKKEKTREIHARIQKHASKKNAREKKKNPEDTRTHPARLIYTCVCVCACR